MNEYGVIMDDWTWSYSRIKLYQQCPYAFIRKYIYHDRGISNFYADYGSYIHHILQLHYSGKLSKDELQGYFISHFGDWIGRDVPSKIRAAYFSQGFDYFAGDILTPPAGSIIGVEREFEGTISGFKIRGFADLVYQDHGLVICDHKSKQLMPRSLNGRRKKKDAELDDYQRQLHLYAVLVRQELLAPVQHIEFNCFRNGNIIREECTMSKELEAATWVAKSIEEIYRAESFQPCPDFFYCKNLCDLRGSCPYADCF